jgi:hypothetical protein
MTRKDLMRIIEDEVSKIAREPVREPVKELPATPANQLNPVFNPALKSEIEIDEYLFKAGMKEK